jgi:hypothetical protein
MIPTFAIVPLLIAAFVVLTIDHYQLNPVNPVRNIRFGMMVSAVLLMFIQIVLGGVSAWISLVIFLLSAIWLVTACYMLWRRASTS